MRKKFLPTWLLEVLKVILSALIGGGTVYGITSCGNSYDNSHAAAQPTNVNVAPVARTQNIYHRAEDTVYIMLHRPTDYDVVETSDDYDQ